MDAKGKFLLLALAPYVMVSLGCSSRDDQRVSARQASAGQSELAEPDVGELDPPPIDTVDGPETPFAETVDLGPCDEASKRVSGLLPSLPVEVSADLVRHCWTVEYPDDPTRYAGALYAPESADLAEVSLVSVLEGGGYLITSTVGRRSAQAVRGSVGRFEDPSSGDFARYEVAESVLARLSRPRPYLTNSYFVVSANAVSSEIDLFGPLPPDEMIDVSQEAVSRMLSKRPDGES